MESPAFDVVYFASDDPDALYACIGVAGTRGIFRASGPGGASGTWEFLAPESPEWDAIHQAIYRNHRLQVVEARDLPATLPELPPVPAGPFKRWREHLVPEQSFLRADFPRLGRVLAASPDDALTAYFVLHEDTYESAFGDGEFHYLHGVYRSKRAAEKQCASVASGEWMRYHLRSISLRASDARIEITHFESQLYDHAQALDVIRALEKLC